MPRLECPGFLTVHHNRHDSLGQFSNRLEKYHRFKLIFQSIFSPLSLPFCLLNEKWVDAHWGKNQLFIQKLPRIWSLKNVNFAKNKILKLWILWKMIFWKREFCEKWDFSKHEFLDKSRIFAQVCRLNIVLTKMLS